MARRYWKNEYEYQRILEILDDYWLTEKDEDKVEVVLRFRHKDGSKQEKVIRWENPNIERPNKGLRIVSLAEILATNYDDDDHDFLNEP